MDKIWYRNLSRMKKTNDHTEPTKVER